MGTQSKNSSSTNTFLHTFDTSFSPRIYEDSLGKLTYFHAPKCASRTILGWMAFAQNPSIQQEKEFGDSFLLGDYPKITAITPEVSFSEMRNALKFCIVRDPVERFVSAYKDRVLRYRGDELKRFPTIQNLLKDLSAAQEFRSLFHHLKPMTCFYGEDTSLFDRVFSFSRLDELRVFLEQEYDVRLPHLHLQSSSRIVVPQLSLKEVDFLREVYREDYRIYGQFI